MAEKTNSSDNLYELFVGEYVSMLLNASMESAVQNGDKVEVTKAPLSVVGYLTDEDDIYFYLGYEENVYSQAVKKEYVIHIEVLEEPENELLSVKSPDGKDYN